MSALLIVFLKVKIAVPLLPELVTCWCLHVQCVDCLFVQVESTVILVSLSKVVITK